MQAQLLGNLWREALPARAVLALQLRHGPPGLLLTGVPIEQVEGRRGALQRPPLSLPAVARGRSQLPELQPLRARVLLLLGGWGWRLLLEVLLLVVLVLAGTPLLWHRWPLLRRSLCQAVASQQRA